jgi:hypothetical protein
MQLLVKILTEILGPSIYFSLQQNVLVNVNTPVFSDVTASSPAEIANASE